MYRRLIEKVEKIIGDIDTNRLLEEQGCTSEVRRIVTDKSTYLLKSAYKEKYRMWLKEESKVLENAGGKGIPIPRYFGFIEEKDSSHLIMSFEDGITLTNALRKEASLPEKKGLITSFGYFLNQFHEQKPIGPFIRESGWLEEQLVKAQSYIENGQTDGSLELLFHLNDEKPHAVQQTMIHGDCTTDNVLVIDGKVQLFIDVSGMTVGDPRYDESLAIRSFVNNPEYIHAFYEGYKRYKVTQEEFQYFEQGLYEFF